MLRVKSEKYFIKRKRLNKNPTRQRIEIEKFYSFSFLNTSSCFRSKELWHKSVVKFVFLFCLFPENSLLLFIIVCDLVLLQTKEIASLFIKKKTISPVFDLTIYK